MSFKMPLSPTCKAKSATAHLTTDSLMYRFWNVYADGMKAKLKKRKLSKKPIC
jgi:hypothetical protein